MDHIMTIQRAKAGATMLAAAALLSVAGACAGDRITVGPDAITGPFVVSNPILAANGSSGLAAAPGLLAGNEYAYLSLAPGQLPEGVSASIVVRHAGPAVVVTIIDGGFDPVTVQVAAGDTIDIVVLETGGGTRTFAVVVPTRRPPVVVRTNPPPKKRDVPLNAVIMLVFSEPVDSTGIGSAVRLMKGAVEVGGRLLFIDAAHTMAELVPDAPLVGGTDYELIVTQGLRDLDGESLPAPLSVTFTTVSVAGPDSTSGFHLSRPIASLNGPVTWVSLSTGLIRGEAFPTIINLRTRDSITAPFIDGAFGPVALPAMVGDSIFIRIPPAGVGTWVVPATSRPSVVRTSPTVAQRGVPTDAAVTIVFSEPIEAASLNSVAVRLERGVTAVAADLRFADSAHTTARLTPNTILADAADYKLIVTRAIRGVAGDSLAATVTTDFSTAAPLVFTSVSAGGKHACGVTTTNAAYCWGDNSYGQLGDGTKTSRSSWVPVAGGIQFRSINATGGLTCGLTTAGAAWCWGSNVGGRLGNGSATGPESCTVEGVALACSTLPVAVAGNNVFASLSVAGSPDHRAADGVACGVTNQGAALCWGARIWGLSWPSGNATPVPVAPGITFASLTAGRFHFCGIAVNGAAYCWGNNQVGQLGDGTQVGVFARDAVTPVAGGLSFSSLTLSDYTTCGLTTAGAAYCWGENRMQTTPAASLCSDGSGWSGPCSLVPVAFDGGLTYATFELGPVSCAVTTTGAGLCWRLKLSGDLSPPTPVSGGLIFASITTSTWGQACGLTTFGEVSCWSYGWDYEPGNGAPSRSKTATR